MKLGANIAAAPLAIAISLCAPSSAHAGAYQTDPDGRPTSVASAEPFDLLAWLGELLNIGPEWEPSG